LKAAVVGSVLMARGGGDGEASAQLLVVLLSAFTGRASLIACRYSMFHSSSSRHCCWCCC